MTHVPTCRLMVATGFQDPQCFNFFLQHLTLTPKYSGSNVCRACVWKCTSVATWTRTAFSEVRCSNWWGQGIGPQNNGPTTVLPQGLWRARLSCCTCTLPACVHRAPGSVMTYRPGCAKSLRIISMISNVTCREYSSSSADTIRSA
jgi:hypothetical protein